jgi:sterol 24-C-methyltransferase
MHGQSANQKSPLMAMLSKDSKAQQVAADAYFRHWDNKDAKIETKEDREVRHFFLPLQTQTYFYKSEQKRRLRKYYSAV